MSGAGDNRSWRRSGQANRASGTNTPTRDGGRQQAMSALTGNAWGGKGKAAGGDNKAPAQPTATPSDNHVPVRDFNSNEVKDFLKKKYNESVADQPAVYHKVQGDSVAKRSSGAWGSRGTMSHLMPGGQDFFTQLKKQLAGLEQNKPS